MSLREEAIKQFEDRKAERTAKEKKEHDDAIARYVARAKKNISDRFGLSECPELVLEDIPDQFAPKCYFDLDGIRFLYILGNDALRVEVSCPKCGSSWLKTVRISTTDGKTDLTDLGGELLREHNQCPADQPNKPSTPQRPPVKTVEYAIGSSEQQFLEALDELVSDVVSRHQE